MKKFLLLFSAIVFSSCNAQKPKINGVSFVGSPTEITSKAIEPVVKVNANWAAVMPFGFIRTLETPEIVFNIERQWWGERRDGAKRTIELLHERGIRVMLKPQIWVWRGEFTGNIKMNTEQQWKQLEQSYSKFILLYAELAREMKIPILCIGTELHTFVQTRPEYWKDLIKEIRSIYKGKLTYAENWDQFNKVPFLDQMDYIGIDAYFPLSESQTPELEQLKKGWGKHKNEIEALQSKIQKPVLFTEYGYRSVHYSGKEPWDSNRINGNVNHEAQKNALTALYNEFWNEPWFAGGFLWKWFHNHDEVGGDNNNRFTVQNKPAEELIRSFYKSE